MLCSAGRVDLLGRITTTAIHVQGFQDQPCCEHPQCCFDPGEEVLSDALVALFMYYNYEESDAQRFIKEHRGHNAHVFNGVN